MSLVELLTGIQTDYYKNDPKAPKKVEFEGFRCYQLRHDEFVNYIIEVKVIGKVRIRKWAALDWNDCFRLLNFLFGFEVFSQKNFLIELSYIINRITSKFLFYKYLALWIYRLAVERCCRVKLTEATIVQLILMCSLRRDIWREYEWNTINSLLVTEMFLW